ncbi:hypothetical protein MP228_011797 [Amoeboaphelidium protococcarum]|nr:hypothetical protein MP228_011797 [Amoeboaphelidium protococcarum]
MDQLLVESPTVSTSQREARYDGWRQLLNLNIDQKRYLMRKFVVVRAIFVSLTSLVNILGIIYWLVSSSMLYNPSNQNAIANYESQCLSNVTDERGVIRAVKLSCVPQNEFRDRYCMFGASSCLLLPDKSGSFSQDCISYAQQTGRVRCRYLNTNQTRCIPFVDNPHAWNEQASITFVEAANTYYPNQLDQQCDIIESQLPVGINQRFRKYFNRESANITSREFVPYITRLDMNTVFIMVIFLSSLSLAGELLKTVILLLAPFWQFCRRPAVFVFCTNGILLPQFILFSKFYRHLVKQTYLEYSTQEVDETDVVIPAKRRFIAKYQILLDFVDRTPQFLYVIYLSVVTRAQTNALAFAIRIVSGSIGILFTFYVGYRVFKFSKRQTLVKSRGSDV